MSTHATLIDAARTYGTAHGIHGKAMGWLVKADGSPFLFRGERVQGWENYGLILVGKGVIEPQDAAGDNVRETTRGSTTTVRPFRQWRELARQFVIRED